MIITEDIKHGTVTIVMNIDESIALQDILKHQKSIFAKELYKVMNNKNRRSK